MYISARKKERKKEAPYVDVCFTENNLSADFTADQQDDSTSWHLASNMQALGFVHYCCLLLGGGVTELLPKF